MAWKDSLRRRIKSEWDSLRASHSPPPPPGAAASAQAGRQTPQPAASGDAYWQPRFRPDVPVSDEWEAKLGNGPDDLGNQELQHYTAEPGNSFHTDDGRLVIRAVANNASPDAETRFTSARLVSRQTLARDRGVLTAVIMSPCADGIWPAFWLLPREPFSWPTDGEIDIAETWNGDLENKSCLHWGFHHEPHKHRVRPTPIPNMHRRPVRYDFAWHQERDDGSDRGRMLWYIDGAPVMKVPIPEGTRLLRDMNIFLNVAMGGNVCAGKTPADGCYDMVVSAMLLAAEPEHGGWERFERDWESESTPYGNTY